MNHQEDMKMRTKIATLMARRCSNCYCELPGYQVKATGWNWITSNFGPFCDDCFVEIKPLLIVGYNEK